MTLEFNQVVEQVYRMASMLEKLNFDIGGRLELAESRFEEASDLDAVNQRIGWVRQSEISGYRGATPLPINPEPINHVVDAPPMLNKATIIAADGSQVYPDEHALVHYYLLNIALYVYYHGVDRTPEQLTYPQLFYHHEHVHDKYGSVIRNGTVDDRRTLDEIARLAQTCRDISKTDAPKPLVALYDNRLMYLPANDESNRTSEEKLRDFIGSLVRLHDSGATLAGYIDNPFRSKRFVQLLYLMSIKDEAELHARRDQISRAGDLDGLTDQQFFFHILKKGQRSALMVQNSPQNKVFGQRGENYEIAFFYLKVYNNTTSKVVRVDVPMWVARDEARVNQLHALLLHQCRLQGRNPYPYAITRADELAWVGIKDRNKLDELVNAQIRRIRHEVAQRTLTAKERGKEIARSAKRYHSMLGEEIIDER